MDDGLVRSSPFDEVAAPPPQLRWQPLPIPATPTDFVDGLVTMAGNGDAQIQYGRGRASLRGKPLDDGPPLQLSTRTANY